MPASPATDARAAAPGDGLFDDLLD